MIFLGVDTGGTFTDFVLWRDGKLRVHKLLSTPHAPEQAILQGIKDLGLQGKALRLVHGSTVATNAVLEGKGVGTLFVTNRGFADMLNIGRQNRAELYTLQPEQPSPPVPEKLCVEVGGRLSAGGELLEALTGADLEELVSLVATHQPRSVAVNLLFSWLDDSAEKAIAAALPDEVFVSLSSRILPEIREYERGMATWLNAWVGPLVQGYLKCLQSGLPNGRVSVMQSSGDTVTAARAGEQAVRMLLSGPAGGLVAAGHLGRKAHCRRMLSFDMGGTSTDVALLDGEPRLTTEGRIGPYPVAVPMVDMHTIGAGGGSIAWLDEGGMLQVGPESAGADPGPACYGRGGARPTVTDANLILGRLLPDVFLGGRMQLDVAAARKAMRQLADAMRCGMEEAASGVLRIANEHMARALRTISVQRGIDPSGFTLVSFGGAGGLHVCALAEALGMQQALVPAHGGVLSALGMLVARPGRQLSRTWLVKLNETSDEQLNALLDELAQEALASMSEEGIAKADCELEYSLDLRYVGQSYSLNIPWTDVAQASGCFHRNHAERYGHELDLPLELVNLRVSIRGPGTAIEAALSMPERASEPFQYCRVAGKDRPAPCFSRNTLTPGQEITGPAIITETVATTWLEAGWRCVVDATGNLLLTRNAIS
ncbi:hydantoinase/oxoprolinase family protein [Thiolapillus sp.]